MIASISRTTTAVALLAVLATTTTTAFAPLTVKPITSQRQSPLHQLQNKVQSTALHASLQDETVDKLAKATTDASDDDALFVSQQQSVTSKGNAYANFAKQYPFANNLAIATTKTAAADLLAQTVNSFQQASLNNEAISIINTLESIDVQRVFLFCTFGALYLGAFQYFYQVQVFKRLFKDTIDRFTSQTWAEKLQDKQGLQSLAAQTALDLTVLTIIYLPTFYIFKAGVFTGSSDPSVWVSTGIDNYTTNFAKDELDLIRVWLPADLVCFSVPLYLRLPVRHVVSFVWTAYLSFARGGH